MAAKKRAMSSEVASEKKIFGHRRESAFAALIGGEVNRGGQQDKKDVIDRQHRPHSVKSGDYWQIFLYRRSRLTSNTILQGIGDLAPLMAACLDAFPKDRETYVADKAKYKTALQGPMRGLLAEIKKDSIRRAFYQKALFNGEEVNYLSAYDGSVWHVFQAAEVVDYISGLEVANSVATSRAGSFAEQKVLIKADGINMGEIEVRNDSKQHYREMKLRIIGVKFLPRLIKAYEPAKEFKEGLLVYGQAQKTFKID